MEHKTKKREEGMLTVEAVLSLVPFIIVILGIISFTNIFVVHNKIQHALFQMGNELSCYTYFYEALGIRSADLSLKNDIDKETEDVDTAITELNDFLSQIGTFEDSLNDMKDSTLSNAGSNLDNTINQGQGTVDKGKQLVQTGRELISDPQALLRGIVYLGIENAEGAAKTWLLGAISGGLMEVYLDGSFAEYQPISADQYLKYFGVRDGMDGLDFGESELFSDDDYRMIDIVVEYDVEVYILKLFFKDPTIHVVQRCAVPAWLDGDGVHYSKK